MAVVHEVTWRMRIFALVGGLLAAVALAGAVAAPARADDASVLRAWEANDAAFATLGRQVALGARTLQRTGRAGPLLGALVRTRALIIRTRKAVLAEQASTPTGASARAACLRALGHFERSVVLLYRGTVAGLQGRKRTGLALLNQSEAALKQADVAADQATALFRQAGLSPRTT